MLAYSRLCIKIKVNNVGNSCITACNGIYYLLDVLMYGYLGILYVLICGYLGNPCILPHYNRANGKGQSEQPPLTLPVIDNSDRKAESSCHIENVSSIY